MYVSLENKHALPSLTIARMYVTGLLVLDLIEFEGYVYDVINQSQNWHGAKNFCESRDSQLVSITSLRENEFVNNFTTKEYGCSPEKCVLNEILTCSSFTSSVFSASLIRTAISAYEANQNM